MTRRILITGARAPVAIDLARSFDAAGYEVHLADSVTPWAAKWSRVGRGRVHRLPPARWAFDDYAAALSALAATLDVELVIPTCEEVFYVAAAAAQKGFADRTLAPELQTLRKLHSKVSFAQLARSIGLSAPQTWTVSNAHELASLPVPEDQLVFKPEYSRFGTATLIRPDSKRLARISFADGQAWAAQRFVEGTEVCLWSAAVRGRIVASAAYRPAWRFGHAASYGFEQFCNPAVEAVATRVAAETAMTGHLSFDIILTPQGEAVPIECNPRAVSGLHLFDGSASLAHALMGQAPPLQPAPGLRYLAPAMLVLGAPSAIASGRWTEFLADWRRGHQTYFGRNGGFSPDMELVCERFRLVERLDRSGA